MGLITPSQAAFLLGKKDSKTVFHYELKGSLKTPKHNLVEKTGLEPVTYLNDEIRPY